LKQKLEPIPPSLPIRHQNTKNNTKREKATAVLKPVQKENKFHHTILSQKPTETKEKPVDIGRRNASKPLSPAGGFEIKAT